MRSSLRRTLARAIDRTPEPDSRPRSRRILAALASVASLALVTGGLLVAGAAPAEAHTPAVNATCQALTVSLTNYQVKSDDPTPNSLTVQVDGKTVATQRFGNSIQPNPLQYRFSDSTVAHPYVVSVTAFDDPTGSRGWTKTFSGSSVPCAKPTAEVAAAVCSTVNGTTTGITAKFAGLDSARTWDATLNGGPAPVVKSGVTNGTVDFGQQPTGRAYTVTVVDRASPSTKITSSAVTAVKCPQVGSLGARIEPCSTVGGAAGLVVTGTDGDGFFAGRSYQLRLASGSVLGVFTPAADTTTHRFDVRPGDIPAGQEVQLYDTTGGASILVYDFGSDLLLGTCPSTPTIQLSVAPCTVGATASNLSATIGGLTTDRTYQVQVDGVNSGASFTATSAEAAQGRTQTITGVSPGSHTVKVYDVNASTVAAEATVTVLACASLPTVTATGTPCAAPGGTGSLAPSFGGLTSGRSYTITLTSGGNPVPGHGSVTFVAGSTSYTPAAYTGLAPGSYVVKIADVLEPTATASSTQSLADCPAVPKLSALVATCSWQSGTSTVQATASDVANGPTWTVSLLKADSTGAFQPVATRADLPTLTADDLRFTGVENGATYRVTLQAQGVSALAAQATLTPAKCSVSAVEYHQDPTPRLASTGADALVPGIAALILLQLGVALVAVAAIRRRREAGN